MNLIYFYSKNQSRNGIHVIEYIDGLPWGSTGGRVGERNSGKQLGAACDWRKGMGPMECLSIRTCLMCQSFRRCSKAQGTSERRSPDRPCRRVGGRNLVDLRGTSQLLRSCFAMEGGGLCLLAPRALSYFPIDLVFVVVPLPSISIRSQSLFIWIVIGMTWSDFYVFVLLLFDSIEQILFYYISGKFSARIKLDSMVVAH